MVCIALMISWSSPGARASAVSRRRISSGRVKEAARKPRTLDTSPFGVGCASWRGDGAAMAGGTSVEGDGERLDRGASAHLLKPGRPCEWERLLKAASMLPL
jgi:hypothetical protein